LESRKPEDEVSRIAHEGAAFSEQPAASAGGSVAALHSFTPWLQETDAHAAYHLGLIAQVDERLANSAALDDKSCELADKLERWRYQHLEEGGFPPSPQQQALADALQATAAQLAGRNPVAPRRTFSAVHDQSLDFQRFPAAIAALDPAYPLDELIELARQLTTAHFSDPATDSRQSSPLPRMLLYAPLYVSSHCVNFCTYCGFRYPLDIERKQLTLEEVEQQIAVLKERGFRQLLIVGGDFPQLTTIDYMCDVVRLMVRAGIVPSIEIASQPLSGYQKLAAAGVHGLTLYQETYDRALYAQYHLRGPKRLYNYRLESHDRAAEAGVQRLGLGVLLGLCDARQDLRAMMRHALYLQDRFPACTLALSLPRIHEAPEGFAISSPVTDDDLIRFYCVLRLAFPAAHLVLSTRESVALRNRLAKICITQMSAGSSTAPGGYSESGTTAGEQFPVTDHRSPAEMTQWLQQAGFHVV
jgi:2-iminoacetate synthase